MSAGCNGSKIEHATGFGDAPGTPRAAGPTIAPGEGHKVRGSQSG
jgi:hypothetical protein